MGGNHYIIHLESEVGCSDCGEDVGHFYQDNGTWYCLACAYRSGRTSGVDPDKFDTYSAEVGDCDSCGERSIIAVRFECDEGHGVCEDCTLTYGISDDPTDDCGICDDATDSHDAYTAHCDYIRKERRENLNN